MTYVDEEQKTFKGGKSFPRNSISQRGKWQLFNFKSFEIHAILEKCLTFYMNKNCTFKFVVMHRYP